MSSLIQNKSSFYYIEGVTADNFYLDFDEGGGPLVATIASGDYTMEGLINAVQDALNAAGTLTYTGTLLRDEQKFNISATGNFSLLTSTGVHTSNNIFSLIGFTGADRTGSNTYTANNKAGTEYLPQFTLQNYTDPEDLQDALSVSINKSANGKKVEVVKFGTEKFFEFDINFITNIIQNGGSIIESNATGIQDARLFMRFVTSKRELEFMPDRTDKNTFYNILIEKTEESKDGTGYRLKELYTKNLPGYFETGLLKFKLIED